MNHYATSCHMFTGVPDHLITMKPEYIEHPHFRSKEVKAYFKENRELSKQQGYEAVKALGLVIHTSVMLDPATECTAYHPKLGNCPFCFSIDQFYAHCKYDMCEVPKYDGWITGNSEAYHIPWQTQHDCIMNPCLLACAFGHLPQPYEWDENEDTGLDFMLQWSGSELQHLLHKVLDPKDICTKLMEHLIQ